MKKLLILAIVSTLALAGCTTPAEIKHRETMFDKQVQAAKDFTPTPACQIVADGTSTITISGVKSFTCYGDTKQGQAPVYAAPKSDFDSFFDKTLEVAKVLVNPWVSLKIAADNNATNRHASDNAVITNGQTLGTINSISTTGMTQLGTTASEGIAAGR